MDNPDPIERLRAELRDVITAAGGLALPGVTDEFLCIAAEEARLVLARATEMRKRDPMDFQGVLMAVQCGGVSTGRARELLRNWLDGLPANPPPDDTPNPFGMDDNPAEVCTALRQVVERCRDQFLSYETQHRAKGTPAADAKADVNRNMAALCSAALAGD